MEKTAADTQKLIEFGLMVGRKFLAISSGMYRYLNALYKTDEVQDSNAFSARVNSVSEETDEIWLKCQQLHLKVSNLKSPTFDEAKNVVEDLVHFITGKYSELSAKTGMLLSFAKEYKLKNSEAAVKKLGDTVGKAAVNHRVALEKSSFSTKKEQKEDDGIYASFVENLVKMADEFDELGDNQFANRVDNIVKSLK